MKKIRLKKLGHLYATDEMLCMAEQDIPAVSYTHLTLPTT